MGGGQQRQVLRGRGANHLRGQNGLIRETRVENDEQRHQLFLIAIGPQPDELASLRIELEAGR